MKSHALLLAGLFALVAVGSASAAQMKPSQAAASTERSAARVTPHTSDSPWPSLASQDARQAGPQLAQNDRYWRDGRWHSHKEDLRRAKLRKEQARKDAERRREQQRHHVQAQHNQHR
ncbi:hypothetical protein CCOS865_02808 [Pseudomonas reidholzensis]|uniref:Secreted protein n=1 Tax=Pseudomonas reidholzensis TaxID=1785162 RepID=A0A383RVU1_9PSED|nr:hypothetical protein [Pseudomonas reidholzensis]SYX90541.1 hypothetical protein CCOS865_02808 [Pseudomonas reidholzensis]